MIAESKLLGFVLLLLGGRSQQSNEQPSQPNAPPPPLPPPGQSQIPSSDVPVAPVWPIQPPTSLPPFPGAGWEYDEPPSAAVVQRAFALLNSLWARGQGAGVVEMTAGHYVGYRAEMMRNGKKGVTAWRLKPGAVAPSPPPASPQGPFVNPPPFVPPAVPQAPQAPQNPFQPAVNVVPTNPSANALDIRAIQQGLVTLGYNVAVDGKLGPQTQAALRAFQQANPPLAVDGIAGPLTKSTLLARLAGYHGSPVTPAATPSRAIFGQINTTRDVQHALNLAGYGPLTEDGIWGAKSATATRKFQAAHPPLVVDGIAGAETKAALAATMHDNFA